MKYLYIDNIRGIAILMVIFVHSAQKIDGISSELLWMSMYGQMGVQLFFIASAYTLCLSHEKRNDEHYPLTNFYIRRLFRIAPLYYVGIVLYFILYLVETSLSNENSDSYYSIVNVLANVFFLHGFYPAANNNIVPGGWSIGTEVVFYSVFPIIIWMVKKLWNVNKYSIWLLPLIGALMSQTFNLLILFWTNGSIGIANNNFIYFNFFNQLPVFLIGIALFYSEKQCSLNFNIFMFVLFSFFSLMLWRYKINYLFTVIPLLSGISFVFLFLLLRNNKWLTSKIIGKIGKYSYGIYITHFIFAWFVPEYFLYPMLKDILSSNLIFLLSIIITLVGAYLLSSIFYRVIESPVVIFGSAIIRRREAAVSQSNGLKP